MNKDLLIKELAIFFLMNRDKPMDNIEERIGELLSDYCITKVNTTLPSTGDGSTTKYLMEQFMKDKMASGLSKGSLAQYFLAIKKLYLYTQKEVTLVNKNDIVNYLNYYKYSNSKGEQKPNTVRNRYLQLSTFFNWLFVNKYIAENPLVNVPIPKGNIPSKQIITDGEFERIKMVCEDTKNGIKMARDIAMISFMMDSGVRASELSNIQIKDVDWIQNQVIIQHGKGDKSRIVPYSDKTKVRLERYLKFRTYTNNDYLFVHYYRNKKLSVSGIEKIINGIGENAEIKRLHPHLFRATFATNMIGKGVAPSVVKTVLGHSNLNTLESYVQITDKDIRSIKNCY